MKSNRMEDERITSQKRRIQSDAYQILMCCLVISLVIQSFILKASFSQYAVELFCLIGIGTYTAVRCLSIGMDTEDSPALTGKKIIISGLASGAMSVVLLAVLAGERNIGILALFFACYVVAFVSVHMIGQFINKKRLKQINDELDNREMDE